MKQQILLIHGGDAFDNYEEYLENLKSWDLTLDRIRAKGWKSNLQTALGESFDVLCPKMPNPQNAKYEEWKILFDKIITLLNDDIILIGHSLGGIFLVKYLSENKFSKKIKALILVAPPYNTPDIHPLADFVLLKPLEDISKQIKQIIIYHSKDDKVVPFSNTKYFKDEIPNLELITFEDRGHFNQEEFPEIVEKIKNL
jgi:uncharacterized protein